jgi:hypothetical protein
LVINNGGVVKAGVTKNVDYVVSAQISGAMRATLGLFGCRYLDEALFGLKIVVQILAFNDGDVGGK